MTRVVRIAGSGGSLPVYGIETADGIVRLPPMTQTAMLKALIEERLPQFALEAMPPDVGRMSPISPGKILCVGMNYRDHAEEQDAAVPTAPLLFAKLPSAITGPFDPIVKPADVTQLDYEGELGVVLGRRCRNVPAHRALDHIAGAIVVNDVSARDAQFDDRQWTRGKSIDTFAPCGPALVGMTDLQGLNDLRITTLVNDEIRQDSSTKQLIFTVDELVAYCSRYFTLEPGDLILTGTPGGVGVFRDPPTFLAAGDTVEVTIEELGSIRNRVVDQADEAWDSGVDHR